MSSGNIRKVDIDSEVQQSYLDYAMSVIVARALPDARDGLKPAQRRILFAMHDMGLSPRTAFKKSARIVGEVLGKYHPHGDAAVYETMARMAQDFSMRYRTVEGQGNFGSVDGDPPAAMRYTEARLADISAELLADLEKETVAFQPNFDGSLTEPDVLPAAIPNLLVNGATGIAVGMATSIPPHNLGEVIEALVFILRSWSKLDDISVDDLVRFIAGPDFPTGGLVLDPAGSEEGLMAAYGTGRGKVTVRARAHIEEMERGRSRILVTELPYQVNKASLLERIADLVREGTVEGIADLRDESDRQGMRIVIEISRTADAGKVLRDLYKRTPMESTFSIILLALVNGEPHMLTLKQSLRVFVDHRLDVMRKRSAFELSRAKERAHILEGLRVALKNLEEVIRLIRSAKDSEEARTKLQKRFRLSEAQANAILDMPLRRLAALEREKIELEYKEKLALIKHLEKLLASPKMLREAVVEDLQRIKKQYGDPRRSVIVRGWEEKKEASPTIESTAPAQDVWISLLAGGQLARLDSAAGKSSGAGKLPASFGKEPPKFVLRANTNDVLYLFTEKGRAAAVPVHAIPARETPEEGAPFSTLCGLEPPSRVIAGLAVSPAQEEVEDPRCVLLVTRRGMVKKTSVQELPGASSQVFNAVKVAPEDAVCAVRLLSGKDDILLVTSSGMSIRFSEEEVRPMGWAAAGVSGIKITKPDDQIVTALVPHPKWEVFLATSNGYAKRVPVAQYPKQGRYGVGAVTWKVSARTGPVLGAMAGVEEDRGAWILKGGNSKTCRLGDAARRGRPAAGKLLLKLKKGEALEKFISIDSKAATVAVNLAKKKVVTKFSTSRAGRKKAKPATGKRPSRKKK
jgi:DNA gyrase subunit A